MRGEQPLHLVLTAVAGWVHREQARTIAYPTWQNCVLEEQLGNRRLIAARWTFSGRRTGRLGIMKEVRALIVRMAEDDSSLGLLPHSGRAEKLGHPVARSTIAKTLKEQAIPPSRDRPMSCSTFLRAHEDAITATGSFTAEVWTNRGLVTHDVLFVIDHSTRAVWTRPPQRAPVGSPLRASPPTPTPCSWPRSPAN